MLQSPTLEETQAFWGEMDLVKNVDSLFLAPIIVFGPRSLDLDPLLPPTIEQITNNVPSFTTVSSPSMLMTSRPTMPAAHSPPTPTASPSLVSADQKRDVSPLGLPTTRTWGQLCYTFSIFLREVKRHPLLSRPLKSGGACQLHEAIGFGEGLEENALPF